MLLTSPISFPNLGITVDPSPVAFTVMGKDIYWYGIIIACGFLLAVGVAVIGVVFAHNFIIKFVLTAAILFIYCNIYRAQLYKLWQIFMGFVRRYLLHSQA